MFDDDDRYRCIFIRSCKMYVFIGGRIEIGERGITVTSTEDDGELLQLVINLEDKIIDLESKIINMRLKS